MTPLLTKLVEKKRWIWEVTKPLNEILETYQRHVVSGKSITRLPHDMGTRNCLRLEWWMSGASFSQSRRAYRISNASSVFDKYALYLFGSMSCDSCGFQPHSLTAMSGSAVTENRSRFELKCDDVKSRAPLYKFGIKDSVSILVHNIRTPSQKTMRRR